MSVLLWLLACTKTCPPGSSLNEGDGLCYLDGFGEDSAVTDTAGGGGGGGEDSGTAPGVEDLFTYGDPIVGVVSTLGFDGKREGKEIPAEWVDAAMISAEEVVMVGVTGTALLDVETATEIRLFDTNRAYRVDVDPESRIAIVGTISDGLRRVDLDAGTVERVNDGPSVGHEDVSIDGGKAIVAWRSAGAVLLNDRLDIVSTVPATSATAAVLRGDRALFTDEAELVLLDVSDLSAPVELDRVPIPSAGVDLDFDGEQIALGLGGRGVVLFRLEDDTLAEAGSLRVPGNAQGVALDGDYLWIGAWEVSALAWIGEGGPYVLGHEEPVFSAMSIAARDGVAVVADWYTATTIARVDGFAGPEMHASSYQLSFQPDGSPERLSFTNYGAMTLELSAEPPGQGYAVDVTEMTLAPGETGAFTVTPPGGGGAIPSVDMAVTTNDPDEPGGDIRLQPAQGGVGAMHPEMELFGFTWPSTALTAYRLSDYRGKAVFLAYWADY